MTNEQLNEIENLRLAATGGNWQHQRWPCLIWEGDGSESELCAAIGPIYAKAEQPNREQVYADAKFIVAMSEHALPLVKALREAREVLGLILETDALRSWAFEDGDDGESIYDMVRRAAGKEPL